jgi:mannose-6-phosphate isomerase class I
MPRNDRWYRYHRCPASRADGKGLTIRYEPNPSYLPVEGQVDTGWPAAVAALPDRPLVLAIDGPAVLDWDGLAGAVIVALTNAGRAASRVAMAAYLESWDLIVEVTASPELPDDPDFATLASGSLADLFASMPAPKRPQDDGVVVVVFGSGAALVDHDVLWYADLPKRYAEAAIVSGTARNLGQPETAGSGTTRRLFYIDWPLLDRHRDQIAPGIDRWIDVQEPGRPASLDGATLRRTAAALAGRPFRTRPTFNTVSWGGHWGQRVLGMNTEAPNTALGYELIAPESGVLVGQPDGPRVEIPFQLVVAQCPQEVLGGLVHDTFGTSFPVRFDYLDTVDGGNLSVHCHPQADYMRRVFGWPYTQHETYYVMVGAKGSRVFLGLRGGVDVGGFHDSAHAASEHGEPFDIDRYIQSFAATPHQLFMIPAGTPHGSSEGNVVLEVSATPYLYSLRFYDWLRRDSRGAQRPVHVDHAFANLNTERIGKAVREELLQPPRQIRSGADWREELLGTLPEMFFEIRRIDIVGDEPAPDDTAGRFHVLNLVQGEGVEIEAAGGVHPLAYAETLVVPASVGPYSIRRIGTGAARLVKALVR